MKKLINEPGNVVREMLEGAVALMPGTALLETETVVTRHPLPASKSVALLSGGGSGHEPAHAGFVGEGMLAAAVAGDVFTSPSSDAVLAGIRAVAGAAGALLIVKNYTGDRLNFGLAAELARAEGIPVEVVVVADDVALKNTVEKSRRRGIAGTVLVHKVAGAAAASGKPLEEVARIARLAAERLGSVGVALGACTLPSVGHPGFILPDDEIELGLGIHGEPGVRRSKMLPATDLVDEMLSMIVEDLDVQAKARVCLLVNGLGATPPMELNIVTKAALDGLDKRGIEVCRAWSGTLLSALDMPGCSLSLLLVDDELLALLDAPTDAPAWPGKGRINQASSIRTEARPSGSDDVELSTLSVEMTIIRDAILSAAEALIAAEQNLTDLDTKAGDGDLGSSMARGARAIQDLPASAWTSPPTALSAIGNALRRAIGGSSGPFYATALLRASRHMADSPAISDVAWAEAFELAVQAISELGGAKPGDRTMLDALSPAASAFSSGVGSGHSLADSWKVAVLAAENGANDTASMQPRLGRASYLGERAIGIPDGGAVAVTVWMKALRP